MKAELDALYYVHHICLRTITSCLSFFLHEINVFFVALCRIYFKVHFIKIVACYSIWIYRRSLAFIGLVMIHLTALDAVCVYTYCWYSILAYSHGEKMSQSYWLLYMSLSIVGIEIRWCTHVQQYIYKLNIRRHMWQYKPFLF